MKRPTSNNSVVLILLAIIFLMSGCATCKSTSTIGPRPSTWAVQMKGNCNVPNLYKISNNFYRSGQPTEEGIAQLADPGIGIKIKTIIDLRGFHEDALPVGTLKLRIEKVPMNAGEEDSQIIDQNVIKVMKILSNKKNGPFLIHCLYGSERTGLICAMYRILYQKWTKDRAIDEMLNGGYRFNAVLFNNMIEYIQKADIHNLQKQINSK
jgi:tyrosine-protein phosphatase SIW14